MEPELSDLQSVRLAKVQEFRDAGVEPYPTRSQRTHTTTQAIDLFESDECATHEVTAAGASPQFATGQNGFRADTRRAWRSSVYLRKDELGEERFAEFLHLFDLGDWVEASGSLFRTRWEVSGVAQHHHALQSTQCAAR